MFNNDSAQAYREAILALKEELKEQRQLVRELTDKLMSRDLSDYKSAGLPPTENAEIKEEDSPYLDPESVPDKVSDEELGQALRK